MKKFLKKKDLKEFFEWQSKALFVDKGQVELLDPHDKYIYSLNNN